MNQFKEYISTCLNENKERVRSFNDIRPLFDASEKTDTTIDDLTWDDLDMDKVYRKLDRTFSSPGEASLYCLLRNPLMNKEKLLKRDKTIEFLKNDSKLSGILRNIFFNLNIDSENRLLKMLANDIVVSKLKFFIYFILGYIIPPALIILAIVLKEPRFMIALLVSVLVNVQIADYESKYVKSRGLIYLRNLISSAKKICNLKNENLSAYTGEIQSILKELKSIDRSTAILKLINSFGGLLEMLAIPFLIEQTTYYKISGKLQDKTHEILKLYYIVGELDALLSIASYKTTTEGLSSPTFTDSVMVNIEDGIHPLLKNPVANSISITNKGIVLTGTNMSGKSTFIRMLSINILLAQCFNFVLAKKYVGTFFNIVSSISPKDDVDAGKSYYLAEAEGILRILKALDKNIPVFCPIDEIFRGTNPVERISSSAEILKYINNKNAICIVATHDRELSEMLAENYDFYHFSENVNENTGLSFDYKLKPGIIDTSNAIKILEYIGYPKEITQGAYKRAKALR
ncbi:MAG: DNA mismatch repair protein MutS [Clostridiaceae bacterium]|nr:DNA mismatch repair protein MutS [Clostridiaceae bacterium]